MSYRQATGADGRARDPRNHRAPHGAAGHDRGRIRARPHGAHRASYRLDYVTVVTVQDGLITHYRDYWSPLAAASAARNALPELLGSPRPGAAR